ADGRADLCGEADRRRPRAPRRAGGAAAPDPGALAAHRSTRSPRGTPGDDLGRADRGRGARPGGGAARGTAPDDLRGVPARPAVTARQAAFQVVQRVFEQDAYADRAFATAAAGLERRERAFAQQLAYGTVQRVRTLDHAIETLARRP